MNPLSLLEPAINYKKGARPASSPLYPESNGNNEDHRIDRPA